MTCGVESKSASHRSLVAREFCHARARPVHCRRVTPGPPEAGLAARVAAGPGAVGGRGLAGDLRRESLPEALLAGGAIAAAAAAEHGHKQERALNAEVTALCLVTGALFPVLGYDSVLALRLRHARASRSGPAPRCRPARPTRKARARHGEAAGPRHVRGRRGAGRHSRGPGRDRVRPGDHPDRRHHPGTVRRPAARGGVRGPRGRRETRCCGWSGCCTPAPAGGRPPPSAATSTARTPWPTGCRTHSAPGSSTSPTAASSPWTAGSGSPAPARTCCGASRTRAKSVPFRTLKTLKDGSELVLLRESGGMRARRRATAGDPALPSLPGHRRPAGLLHRADPHPRRPGEDHPDPAPDHAAGPGPLPRRGTRRPVPEKMADRNRVLALEDEPSAAPAAPCAGARRPSPARKPGRCCSPTT